MVGIKREKFSLLKVIVEKSNSQELIELKAIGLAEKQAWDDYQDPEGELDTLGYIRETLGGLESDFQYGGSITKDIEATAVMIHQGCVALRLTIRNHESKTK